ncbi:hypothetical protein EHZ19_01160 [Paraburkholderia bannensis]|nr:hypothetical protein EHZ19_01160 [Paraburkholderia bannensis]RQN40490.1 hypothetical protein EHZ25_03705 [Paraburkholderia tropica]
MAVFGAMPAAPAAVPPPAPTPAPPEPPAAQAAPEIAIARIHAAALIVGLLIIVLLERVVCRCCLPICDALPADQRHCATRRADTFASANDVPRESTRKLAEKMNVECGNKNGPA